MRKWTVLTVLLVAIVAVSNVQSRRGSRLFRMVRPASTTFQISQPRHFIGAAPPFGGFVPSYNMPTYNMPMMGRRMIPDGEYISPNGMTTTVDGSDISYDHNTDFYPMPMMG